MTGYDRHCGARQTAFKQYANQPALSRHGAVGVLQMAVEREPGLRVQSAARVALLLLRFGVLQKKKKSKVSNQNGT